MQSARVGRVRHETQGKTISSPLRFGVALFFEQQNIVRRSENRKRVSEDARILFERVELDGFGSTCVSPGRHR